MLYSIFAECSKTLDGSKICLMSATKLEVRYHRHTIISNWAYGSFLANFSFKWVIKYFAVFIIFFFYLQYHVSHYESFEGLPLFLPLRPWLFCQTVRNQNLILFVHQQLVQSKKKQFSNCKGVWLEIQKSQSNSKQAYIADVFTYSVIDLPWWLIF